MAFSIRLTEEEHKLATSYAKTHSLSLSEAFKQALFERIEDEYDLTVAKEAYQDYVASGCQSTPIADFWRELESVEDCTAEKQPTPKLASAIQELESGEVTPYETLDDFIRAFQ